jgi:hypothetical protein
MQNNPASRPITPDTILSSFPSLQPASHRAPVETSSSPWSTTQRTMSNPSMTTLAGLQNATTAAAQPLRGMGQQTAPFSIPPPPASNAFSAQTKPIANQQFTIPRPPPPNTGNVQNWNQQPQYGVGLGATSNTPNQSTSTGQGGQKSGLDKYQSLL